MNKQEQTWKCVMTGGILNAEYKEGSAAKFNAACTDRVNIIECWFIFLSLAPQGTPASKPLQSLSWPSNQREMQDIVLDASQTGS